MEECNSSPINKFKVTENDLGENNEPKRNSPGTIKNLICYVTEFCEKTSLHGLKFLGEKKRLLIEKLWWLLIIGASMYVCGYLIVQTYNKWQMAPVIVNFATTPTPIWKIPFPAVTVCPEIKSYHNLFNYTEMNLKARNNTLTEKEKTSYQYMSLVCFSHTLAIDRFVDESLYDFVTEVCPTVKKTLWKCRWMGISYRCSELFVPIITDVGVCFSFNILDFREMFTDDVYQYKNYSSTRKIKGWSAEHGYGLNEDTLSYPRRALFAGVKSGLVLNLETRVEDKDYFCTGGMQGYKVHLHNPADMPVIDENYFKVGLDEYAVVAVKPNAISTHGKLNDYPYKKRNCYFPTERPLRFFKVYSQQNCLLECMTNFTLQTCNCVNFHMPRLNSTAICGPKSRECLLLAEQIFLTNEVTTDIRDEQSYQIKNKTYQACNCYPSCVNTNFDGEVSQTPWEWQKYYVQEEFRNRTSEVAVHTSKLIVYFKEKQIMTYQRNELYGKVDFIANCGGILGLFIGFSVISFMEFFYFLTLRFWCNLKKFGRHFWSGDEELLTLKQA